MRTRTSLGLALLALAALAGPARAQKLDKDDKKWLDEVRPILPSDEEKQFKGLKDKADRVEFQKIFWARRDPDLATPENEFQLQYTKDRAEADQQFRVSAQVGSNTDCGRVFILLGKPDEVQKDESSSLTLRGAETWIYDEKPGRPVAGKTAIAFDGDCRGNPSLGAQLDRVASGKVVHLSIDYRKDKDGHIVKLADQLPRDTKARALFKTPREDFKVAAQAAYLKVADGSTALVGLVRGDASGLAAADAGGAKTVQVSVAASVVAEDGKEVGWVEQTMNAPVGADGAFVGSFKMGLKPGRYTLKAGAVDLKGGKASLASTPIEVPNLAKVEPAADGSAQPVPSAASVILLRDVEEIAPGAAVDPAHPFAAYSLPQARLIPLFGTTLHKADQLSIFYQVYDLTVGPAGKADGLAILSILKDGKAPVARTQNPIDTPNGIGGSVVGPVPLAGYEVGKYVVQLKVTDKLSKKDVTQETPLEILP
jgi:GWxTD domain-containing protein